MIRANLRREIRVWQFAILICLSPFWACAAEPAGERLPGKAAPEDDQAEIRLEYMTKALGKYNGGARWRQVQPGQDEPEGRLSMVKSRGRRR